VGIPEPAPAPPASNPPASPPASGLGTAVLSWSAPTQNIDGSALGNLAGYRVYHGTDPATLSNVVQLQGAGQASYTFTDLANGTHYFSVAALTAGGVEGERSPVRSKTIP
jgi:hypothetical protein